ncbi:hypothetical protein GCM10010172_66740 [Paractinoplanes ferrugineus]|uniref:ATP-grasp domain-containing protein n=1 Tax=Paractinoplanes ferrugineus TaxID=113564 RepID=A0A919J280_9ACTN|nr:hypothetical protein [Actinoplanes ferrugineus]GIE13165.1 hypothetical protein Afe05nite_50050 [Actinoplanes ferrugineus]
MTIHVIGTDTDTTTVHFAQRAHAAGHRVEFVNLRAVVRHPWHFELDGWNGVAHLRSRAGVEHHLPGDGSYYARVVDLSPVLDPDEGPAWTRLVMGLTAFLDAARGTVVNRPSGQAHNGSKPLHEWWLARQGFLVPPSRTTSDRERILDFLDRHGPVIVKTITGVRGAAQLVDAGRFASFDASQGPVHLQRRIEGFDVRVHLVGGEAFAERIDGAVVDYRTRGADITHRPVEVPDELVVRMRSAAETMGLAFTGWDFRVDAQDRWWCLEANPMPGYDWYDRRCDGAISAALCRVLAP